MCPREGENAGDSGGRGEGPGEWGWRERERETETETETEREEEEEEEEEEKEEDAVAKMCEFEIKLFESSWSSWAAGRALQKRCSLNE